MNILNTLKNWIDSERISHHSSQNNPPVHNSSGSSSSAFAHHANPHSDNNSKSSFDSLLATLKKSFHHQSGQLNNVAADLGKKLSQQGQDAISSVFSSAKSALLKQTSRDTTENGQTTNYTHDTTQSSATSSGVLSSISNTVSTKASTALNQGKDKIQRSIADLKQSHTIPPALVSFYQKSVSAIKSKTDDISDSTSSVTDTAKNQINQHDSQLKNQQNPGSVNSMAATAKAEVSIKQPELTETSAAPQTPINQAPVNTVNDAGNTSNEATDNVSKMEALAANPEQKTETVENKPEISSTMSFQEKEVPVAVETQKETIDQGLANQASVERKQAILDEENIQSKTAHPEAKPDTITEEYLSSKTATSSITGKESLETPPSKSPLRIMIPLGLLLLSLVAIWQLGFNQPSFTNNDNDLVAQQPVTPETQQSSIVASTENTEITTVIEPSESVQTIAATAVNSDSGTAQVETQVVSEVDPVKPSAIPAETPDLEQTAMLNTPQQDSTSKPVSAAETISLSNLAPPLDNMVSYIKSGDSLPTAFTLDGMRFIEKDSSQITGGSAQIISDLGAVMNAYPNVQIRLESHTDSRGQAETNIEQTQALANEAKNQLVNLGVDPARIEAVGMGEEKPIDGNFAEAWKSKNRRVIAIVTAR